MRGLIIPAFAILLVSCATTTANYYTKTVSSWQGGNAKTLIKTWGRPDTVTAIANGNTIYLYRTRGYSNASNGMSPAIGVNVSHDGRAIMTSQTSPYTAWNRGSLSLNCATVFVIDKQGTVVDTQTKGNGCYGSESFAKRLSNPR